MRKRGKSLLLMLILAAGMLAGCGSKETKAAVRVGFLKGPTGVGAAYLIDQNAKGAYDGAYEITLESDASVIAASVVSGELDIAAVPTNVAASLYNKTDGGIRILAVNTLGVLYILEKGDAVHSVADLAGRTICATGQAANPEYVLNYILERNGLTPGEGVTVTYMTAEEVVARMLVGDADLCMLPVPYATALLYRDDQVRSALDLTDEWSALGDASALTQGCLIVRNGALDDGAIAEFLKAYGDSIAYMSDPHNITAAAGLTVAYGIVGNGAIAEEVIPDCNLVFITGAEGLRDALSGYYGVLYAADPTSVGGRIPDDAIYYDYTG